MNQSPPLITSPTLSSSALLSLPPNASSTISSPSPPVPSSSSPPPSYSTTAPLTITRTFFKTSTLPPIFATHSFTSYSTPSFLTIPYTETILTTTQITLTTYPPAPALDSTSWDRIFPALLVFALIGLFASLSGLSLCVFYMHRRCYPRKPSSPTPTADGLAIGGGTKESATFVPIESSPLTLVPRAAIWQDPNRRRGVNELDLWERKQQPGYDEEAHGPPILSFPPPPQPDEEEEEDRPWRKYVQSRPQPLSDLAHAITLAKLDDDDDDANDDRSMHTIGRESLRPISYLHQEVEPGLEGSGSSQWLYPPTSTFRK